MSDKCPSLLVTDVNKCCDYMPPKVENLLIIKTKKGKFKIKINGVGKWLAAQYDEQTHKLTFSA